MDAISESSDSALVGFASGMVKSAIEDKRAFDSSTVANSVRGSITDADELSRQVEALAAVAAEFERSDAEAVSA